MCIILISYRVESVPGPLDPGVYFLFLFGYPPGEVKGISRDTQAAHEHGGDRNQWIQQTAHGYGNTDQVIQKGKNEILFNRTRYV